MRLLVGAHGGVFHEASEVLEAPQVCPERSSSLGPSGNTLRSRKLAPRSQKLPIDKGKLMENHLATRYVQLLQRVLKGNEWRIVFELHRLLADDTARKPQSWCVLTLPMMILLVALRALMVCPLCYMVLATICKRWKVDLDLIKL